MTGERRRRTSRASDRMQMLIDGEIKIEDLDDEELRRGQLRSKDGDFRGRPPQLIPRTFHEAIVRELIERGNAKLRDNLEASLSVITQMAMNPKTPARERLAAAQYVVERTMGKIPEKQIVQAQVAKWEAQMEDVVFDIPDGKD